MDTIFALRPQSDDDGAVHAAVHRVVDAASHGVTAVVSVQVVGQRVVDLIAADDAVELAVERRLPFYADRRRVDGLDPHPTRLSRHCMHK